MSRKYPTLTRTIRLIQDMGLRCATTGYGDELKVDYHVGDPRRTRDSAYFTNSRLDALETARLMASYPSLTPTVPTCESNI